MDSHNYNHPIKNEGSLETEGKGCCFQTLVMLQLDMGSHIEKKKKISS